MDLLVTQTQCYNSNITVLVLLNVAQRPKQTITVKLVINIVCLSKGEVPIDTMTNDLRREPWVSLTNHIESTHKFMMIDLPRYLKD